MNIKKGDIVTRRSYNHDTAFKVINVKDGIYFLKGIEARLLANSNEDDLVIVEDYIEDFIDVDNNRNIKEDDFFYLPAKILHIDGDNEYLEKCLKYYKKNGVYAIGKKIKEDSIHLQLNALLTDFKPDILIITGHDAFYSKKGPIDDIRSYKNTADFIKAIKVARNYERSHEKLVVIAGACQSYYEELIKSGANFASSPKRVNIHALDPAIIATTIALTEKNKEIDLLDLLDKTKYGKDGVGGLYTRGFMYVGYPR
ncbi:MAG: sporulation peptidase YabG [bacterium]